MIPERQDRRHRRHRRNRGEKIEEDECIEKKEFNIFSFFQEHEIQIIYLEDYMSSIERKSPSINIFRFNKFGNIDFRGKYDLYGRYINSNERNSKNYINVEYYEYVEVRTLFDNAMYRIRGFY
jgi:hypothetical protein